jgi:hypothetical protein
MKSGMFVLRLTSAAYLNTKRRTLHTANFTHGRRRPLVSGRRSGGQLTGPAKRLTAVSF